MEVAAKVIIRKAVQQRSWDVMMSLDDFSAGNERDGFLNLLHYGWLRENRHNPSAHGEFAPNDKFIERMERAIERGGQ